MNKSIRIIALIACAAILCAALCSCQMLDEAKKTTAYFTDDTMKELTFHGNTYKLVDSPKGVSFLMNDTIYGYHAAAPDVPVLLAGSYGKSLVFQREEKDDPRIVAVISEIVDYYGSGDFSVGSYYSDKMTYYLKESEYESLQKLITDADCDYYFMYTYKYDDDYKAQNILLDDASVTAVKHAMTDGKKVKWSELSSRSEWYGIELFSCDKDKLITDNRNLRIITNSEEFYVYDESASDPKAPLHQALKEDYDAMKKVYNQCEYSIECEDIEGRVTLEEYAER